MKLIINKDRTTVAVGTWGTVNENDFEILDFEFPAELDGYNKRIVYYLDDERVWDAIVNNKAYITNAITTKGDVKAYVWCTKENTEREADTDFRTMLFEMHFYENENADGIVPTEQQVDGFNTMLTAMNNKIDEVDALETTIGAAEAERQEAEATRVSNENTRESNESTRQTNEQTRQTQEADRERRTDEAIADIEDKTAEYNANAEAKTTAFNNNATQKTNEFNSNYTQKVNDFNSNASSKTSAFNSNAETKTNAFNTNATNKTNDFNGNATEKTTTFNDNASTKTSEFNTNAESKTSAFNDNATQKTTNFDNNASEKTDEFNTNAQEKINEYDEHIVEYQAQIDELQEEVEELSENMPWNTTEQATEIQVTDAAKYSRNKLELFGNTEQTQYTGKNCFNKTDYTTIATGNNGNATNVKTENKITITTGNNSISSGIYITKENLISYITNYDSSNTYYVSLDIKANRNIEIKMGCDTRPNFDITTSNQRISVTTLINSNGLIIYSSENNAGDTIEITNIMISTASDTIYEPYVGGQPSPSPDYPQPIHVVTGNNTINIGNTDYPINLGSLELCKIGNSQDYLYKENGNWYKYGAISYNVATGASSEQWEWVVRNENKIMVQSRNIGACIDGRTFTAIYSKYYRGTAGNTIFDASNTTVNIIGCAERSGIRIAVSPNDFANVDDFKNFLQENNLDFYFVLATPTTTQITDETLISQLDAIYEHLQLVKGTNNITVTAEDLAPNMELTYMQDIKSKLDNLDSRLALLE